MEFSTPTFWAALGSIILADILLSGDNALVIALATRALPAYQQRRAVIWGTTAAIVMRCVLTVVAVQLLTLPYLKIVGGLLLFYIGTDLMGDNKEHADGAALPMSLGAAIRTILLADLVMSLDNVLAVAAAARGSPLLLFIGLAVSIPLIVMGSTLLLRLMERFPVIITAGAALLGWLAGEMLLSDALIGRWFGPLPESAMIIAGLFGALLVVIVGKWRHASVSHPQP